MKSFPHQEAELLLCCVRPESSESVASRIGELLRSGVDFDALLQLSLRHGVMPLVYRKLSGEFGGEIPPEEFSKFREHFQANAARNLYLTGELLRVLSSFESAGVQAIPYKGPALAAFLYDDVSLQQFADLDVLVRPADFRRASDILVSRGYAPHFKIDEDEEDAFIRLSYVQLFTRDEGTCLVELHWQIAPRFFAKPLVDEGFWGRLGTMSLAGRDVPAPSNEDLLLMLCVHGTKDIWERLKWVSGVAEFLAQAKEVNWSRLIERATAVGLRRTLLLGLLLAHDLLGAPLDEEVLREIESDRTVRRLAEESRARIFTGLPNLARRTLFHLRSRERLRDRVRYCALFAMTTTPVDWATLRLPRRLAFVHYFLRPFRLFNKYVLGSLRRAH